MNPNTRPISRPLAMQCTACGTGSIKPRIIKENATGNTMAQWNCPRCGNYFHKGYTAYAPTTEK